MDSTASRTGITVHLNEDSSIPFKYVARISDSHNRVPGAPTSDYGNTKAQALLRLAEAHNVSLIPILMDIDMAAFNSMCKYPSIPVYHKLTNGKVSEELSGLPESSEFICTEKIDGTNVRMIFDRALYYIGSRLTLSSSSDRSFVPDNKSLGESATALLQVSADSMQDHTRTINDGLVVVYGELFGGNVGKAARQYSSLSDFLYYRVFDVFTISADDAIEVVSKGAQYASAWREIRAGQKYLTEPELTAFCKRVDARMTPRLEAVPFPPTDRRDVHQWLEHNIPHSMVSGGRAEGIVIRTPDRSWIRKIRYDDYRAFKRKYVQSQFQYEHGI